MAQGGTRARAGCAAPGALSSMIGTEPGGTTGTSRRRTIYTVHLDLGASMAAWGQAAARYASTGKVGSTLGLAADVGDGLDLTRKSPLRAALAPRRPCLRRFWGRDMRSQIGVSSERACVGDVGRRQNQGRTPLPLQPQGALGHSCRPVDRARISPLPTIFPSLSTATCPPTRRLRPPPLSEITTVGGRSHTEAHHRRLEDL